MPALSPTMTEGNLIKWLVKLGDKVKAGDILAEIETDKATMEVEAVDEGFVTDLLFKEGDQSIKVNTVIAILSNNYGKIKENKLDKIAEAKKINPIDNTSKSTSTQNNLKNNDNAIEEKDSSNLVTMRQAIRDAMAEEMKKNELVYIIGEEVGEYQGAYKVTQGLLDEFGPQRVFDTPIS